jgi:arylsulfatase A-like enzyme
MQDRVALTFSRDEVRERVLPAYMGLIKQIDDQLGVLFKFLEDQGLADSTMIVLTSDHGDYMGDHWLGEKQLFHDVSARVPMIIHDPGKDADATRGTVNGDLVEMIDLAPTFLEFFGGAPKPHVLEGRSLMPLLHGKTPADWRRVAISEYDYSYNRPRLMLGTPVLDCRMVMVTDGRWKLVHTPGYRPMLFDLATDPDELADLGGDPRHEAECSRLREDIFQWLSRLKGRITIPEQPPVDQAAVGLKYDRTLDQGILIGYWDEADLAEERRKRAAALAGEKARRG